MAAVETVMNNLDIYWTANLLIEQRGALKAEIEAARRADEQQTAGDMDGRIIWLRVVEAVKELSAPCEGTKP